MFPRSAAWGPVRAGAVPSRGFTLIELMITLALVALLMLVAAPSFVAFQRNSELTTTANGFLATLSAARAEAMKRQLRTFVIPVVAGNWASGWVAFVDVNGNVTTGALSMDAGDIELSRGGALPASVAIDAPDGVTNFDHAGVTYVMFNGSGFMSLIGGGFSATESLDFTDGTESRRVLTNATGRMRVCKPSDAGCSVGDGF